MELNKMLDLWVKITGVNPEENKRKYVIRFDDWLSDWDIKKMNERITEALSYDETGMFATAYLAHYFKEYLSQRKLAAYKLVTDPATTDYINDMKALYAALSEADAENIIMKEAQTAMSHYELDSSSLKIFDVIELRTSAIRCMDTLHTAQFSKGKTASDGFKVYKDIYMYMDINALLTAAETGMIDGVSLCYIREEDLASSYFAFVIKNGENLYLLTDKPSYSHPNQKHMTRCPGRRMADRINSTFFPYSLTNIDMQDMYDSGRYAVKEKPMVIDIGSEPARIKLGDFSAMEINDAFWVIMMLSQIKNKFYDNYHECPELSYAGGMVMHPAIPVNNYLVPLQEKLPHLVLDEITNPEQLSLKYSRESLHLYDHIVDRFIKQVPNELKNPAGYSDKPLLTDKSTSSGRNYLALNLNDFGTADEIKYRQAWIARYNVAVAIQELNKNEFISNKKKVRYDFFAAVERRKEELVREAISGKYIHQKLASSNSFGYEFTDDTESYCKIELFDKWYENWAKGHIVGNRNKCITKATIRCIMTGGCPGIVLMLSPTSANDLAALAGKEVGELPEQLRQWTKERPYTGNSIISNIDPFDWVIKDEYNDLCFDLAIPLSMKAYNNIRKDLGIEKDDMIQNLKPACFKENRDSKMCLGKYRDHFDTASGFSKELLKKCQKCRYYYNNQR